MAAPRYELSAAEWEIMQVIWDATPPMTVRTFWIKPTPTPRKLTPPCKTLMNILVDKKFLKRKKVGMVNFYSAAVSRDKILRKSLSTLAGRMFQGSFGAMASFLVNSASLSPEEIQELKKLLDEQSGGSPK